MPHSILQLDSIAKLPLWAQVLLASRTARRAALAMPDTVNPTTRSAILAGCEAVERCAVAGNWSGEEAVIRRAMDLCPSGDASGAGEAVYFAGDAAHAANDATDFSAAESACEGSVRRSLQAAAGAKGLNALQVMMLIAADLSVVSFACGESRIGRYDRLGQGVMGRLFPVHAPENGEVEKPDIDQLR